jgi:hypothetical protein
MNSPFANCCLEYWSSHLAMRTEQCDGGSVNITAKSILRCEGPAQRSHFSCCIGGLVAGKASVSRNPAKHNRLTCLMNVGHLNQNINDNWTVRGVTTETLQGT